MTYDIEKAAQDLMFETSELKEILDMYFPTALELIAKCESGFTRNNYGEISAALHSLKGSSYNLRINEIGDLAVRYEAAVKAGEFTEAMVKQLRSRILGIQDFVNNYFICYNLPKL